MESIIVYFGHIIRSINTNASAVMRNCRKKNMIETHLHENIFVM